MCLAYIDLNAASLKIHELDWALSGLHTEAVFTLPHL